MENHQTKTATKQHNSLQSSSLVNNNNVPLHYTHGVVKQNNNMDRNVRAGSKSSDESDFTSHSSSSNDMSKQVAQAEERQQDVLKSITKSHSSGQDRSVSPEQGEFDVSMIENLCSLLSSEGHEVMLVAYRHDFKKCFKCGSEMGQNFLSKTPSVMQNFIQFCEDNYSAKAKTAIVASDDNIGEVTWNNMDQSKISQSEVTAALDHSGMDSFTEYSSDQSEVIPMQNIKCEVTSPSKPSVFSSQGNTAYSSVAPETTWSGGTQSSSIAISQNTFIGQIQCSSVEENNHALQGHISVQLSEPASANSAVDPNKELHKVHKLPVQLGLNAQVMSDGKMYKCSVCEEVLQSKSSLDHHHMMHSQRSFKCPHCARIFFRQVDCDRHIVVHGKREAEKCPFCNVTYVSKVGKNRHIKRRHPEEWKNICQETINMEMQGLKCPFCGSIFRSVEKMKRHMRYHKKKIQLTKCFICYKDFQSRQLLEDHIKTHSISLQLDCEFCHEQFDNHLGLEQHKKFCESRKFPCLDCQETFLSLNQLEEHAREKGHTHGITYQNESNSINAIRISNVVSCASDLPSEEDTDVSSLKINNVISCQEEEEDTAGDEEFTIIKNEPEGDAEDDIEEIGQENSSNMEVEDQQGQNPHEMELSIGNAEMVEEMNENTLRMSTALFPCTMCSKGFDKKQSLLKHLKVHLHKGRYQCKICSYSSSRGANLVRHMKIHNKSNVPSPTQVMILKGVQHRTILPKSNVEWEFQKSFQSDVPNNGAVTMGPVVLSNSICSSNPSDIPLTSSSLNISNDTRQNTLSNISKSAKPAKEFKFLEYTFPNNISKPVIKATSNKQHSTVATGTLCHCLICNADFTSYDSLQSHMQKHKDLNEHICHLCHRTFASEGKLIGHKFSAKDQCRLGCEFCGEVLKNRFFYWNHRKIHVMNDDKNYACYIDGCSSKFNCHRILKKHIVALHVTKNIVPYLDFPVFECEICHKLHSLRSDLDYHIKLQHTDKAYKCEECGILLGDLSQLENHVNAHKNQNTVLSCHFCGKKCLSKRDLAQHFRTYHADSQVLDQTEEEEKQVEWEKDSTSFHNNNNSQNTDKGSHLSDSTIQMNKEDEKNPGDDLQNQDASDEVEYIF